MLNVNDTIKCRSPLFKKQSCRSLKFSFQTLTLSITSAVPFRLCELLSVCVMSLKRTPRFKTNPYQQNVNTFSGVS